MTSIRWENLGILRWAVLGLAMVALGHRSQDSRREKLVEALCGAPDGARFVGADQEVLACVVTVALTKQEMNRGVAVQIAATIAAVKARAEVALFIAGEYASSTTTEKSSETTNGKSTFSIRAVQLIQSAARARFASGERLHFERIDEEQVRVIYAWGLSREIAAASSSDPHILLRGRIEQAIASQDSPSPNINIIRLASGEEALLITIKVIAPKTLPLDTVCAHPAGESAQQAKNGKPCYCAEHRRRAVTTIGEATVMKWIEDGDTACARFLGRESTKTIERVSAGAKALEVVRTSSSKVQQSHASTTFKGILGPEWYRTRVVETRVTEDAAVCALLIPIPAATTDTSK